MNPRTLSARALFGLVYTMSISSVYFALGVVAQRALGLTPLVFLIAGVFFALASMTYVEGAALHRERGGSTRLRALRVQRAGELRRRLGDPARLLRSCSPSRPSRRRTTWPSSSASVGRGTLEPIVAIAIIAAVALINVRGVSVRQLRRGLLVALADIAVQLLLIVLGFAMLLHPHAIVDTIHLGSSPTWRRHDLRADDRDDRLHRPGGGGEPRGRDGDDAARPAPPRRSGRRHDPDRLRRDRDRRRERAADRRRAGRLHRRATIEAPLLSVAGAFDPHWLADALRDSRRRHGRSSACWRRRTRRCSGSRGSPTGLRRTARSPARSAACTRDAARRTC